MAQSQNIEFPNYPFSPPHVPPPFHPVAPPFVHPPPFPAPTPPKPVNPPPSPMPKPPPHQVSPPIPKPSSPPPPIPKPHPPPFSPPKPSPKPPSPHPHLPPPPHVLPPPLPPSPTPGHHSTIIIVVFVSLGGLFFLAFLSAALFCFMKKRKRRTIKELDDFKFDERMKVQEEIVRGPHGEQAVLVTFEEDIHSHETKSKDELVVEPSHSHGGLAHHPQPLEVASSTPSTGHHHVGSSASGTT